MRIPYRDVSVFTISATERSPRSKRPLIRLILNMKKYLSGLLQRLSTRYAQNIETNNTINRSALIDCHGLAHNGITLLGQKITADISFQNRERSNLNRHNHNQEQCQCLFEIVFNNITYFTQFKAVVASVMSALMFVASRVRHLRIHINRRWPLSLREDASLFSGAD